MSDSVYKRWLIDAYRMRKTVSASTLQTIQQEILVGIRMLNTILTRTDLSVEDRKDMESALAFHLNLKKGFIDEIE